MYVTGIGMDGCLYYTTVEEGAPNGPHGTGACNMY